MMTLVSRLVYVLPFRWLLRWFRQSQWRRWHWVVLALLGVVLLLLVALPAFLRREIAAQLATATTAQVHLADVDFNLFRGRLALQGLTLTLQGEEQPVLAIRQLEGNLRLLSLLRGPFSIEKVQLSGLRVAVIQQPDGQLNLSRLFPPSSSSEPPPPKTDLPALTIERFAVSDTQIEYEDRTRTPPARFALALKTLATDQIGMEPRGLTAPVAVRFEGTVNDSPVQSTAQVFWQRDHTALEATLETQQFPVVAIEPYLRDTLTLQQLSGFVAAHLRYRYQSGDNQPPVHALGGTLTLEQFRFVDPVSGQLALDLPHGQVTVDTIDLLNRELRLATMELQNPKLFFLQTPNGLNWTALTRTSDQREQTADTNPTPGPVWQFSLQTARLIGGEVVYRDSTWAEAEAITLVPEEIQVQQLGSKAGDSPVRFRLRLDQGTLEGEGSLQLTPFGLHSQVQLTGIELTALRPLLMRTLAVEGASSTVNGTVKLVVANREGTQTVGLSGTLETTALTITGLPQPGSVVAWESGRIELQEGSTVVPLDVGLAPQLVRLSIQEPPQGDVAVEKVTANLRLTHSVAPASNPFQEEGNPTSSLPSLLAHGTVEVSSFLVTHGAEKQEVLSCYQARARLKEGSRLLPLDLQFGDVALEYAYAQGFRTAAGQLQLFIPPSREPQSPAVPAASATTTAVPPAPTPVAAPAAGLAVHIDRATLIGGQLYFEDQAVTPPQTVYWQDVRVDVSTVAYPVVPPATFAVHAFNMDGAPIEFQGTTQGQAEQVVTRIRGKIERLSLPRFNVYFGSLLGYQVRNGAVSLTWDLTLPGDRLQASTTVTLHNLGLGGKEGASILEQQVGLPLHLVIALLKDLNGNINLNLPVAGRFSDPGFQLGGTILRAVRDVLIGAVISPLKLLGAVFTEKDKLTDFTLDPIRFVPGTNEPTDSGKEQLSRLAKFLAQRPEVDLHLSGATGSEDIQALQDRLVLAQLQENLASAATLQTPEIEQEGKPQPPSPHEEVRQFLSQPRDQSGNRDIAALSAEATTLLAQLRERVTVSPQARQQLAQERVQAVITSLTTNAAVSAKRLQMSSEKLRVRGDAAVHYIIQARGGV